MFFLGMDLVFWSAFSSVAIPALFVGMLAVVAMLSEVKTVQR